MNDTHFAIVGAWVAAAIAELLHRRGEKKNSVYSRRASEVTMLAAIITLSIIAWNHPLPEIRFTSATASEPAHSIVQPASSTLEPRGAFVASRNGKTYHVPTCKHYVPHIKGPIWYTTKELATLDSKVPCKECIGRLAAHLPKDVQGQKTAEIPDLETDQGAAEQLVQGNH